MKLLCGYMLTLLATGCLSDTYSITDLCRSATGYKKNLILYGSTEHVLNLGGANTGFIDGCTVHIKSPNASSTGSKFQLSFKFDREYNVGYDDISRHPIAVSGRGLIISKLGDFFVGAHNNYWIGLNDNTGQVGHTLQQGPHIVTRNTSTSGLLLQIAYKGTLPNDELTMRATLTCIPGPCPSAPLTVPTVTTTTPKTGQTTTKESATTSLKLSTTTNSSARVCSASALMVLTVLLSVMC